MAGLQEDTRVNRAVVVGWGVTICSVVLFSGWLAVHLVHARVNGPLDLPVGAAGQVPRFGILEQTQFDERKPQDDQREADLIYLNGYGWLDDAHTRAHVPISRAEKLLLAQQGGADAGSE